MTLAGLNFMTGNVTHVGKGGVAIESNFSPKTLHFILLKTAFVGAVEDRVALASLKVGMSVNFWCDNKTNEAKYASINYK